MSTDLWDGSQGMTLRDWFAGKALQGILGNAALTAAFSEANHQNPERTAEHVSKRAYDLADAMIAQREKLI